MKLLQIINTFALAQPEKTALNDCSGTAVTYAQLMDLSGRVYETPDNIGALPDQLSRCSLLLPWQINKIFVIGQ